MPLRDSRLATLRAAIDRIIPRDDFPSASEAGVLDYIGRLVQGDLRHERTFLADGLGCLDDEAVARHRCTFSHLRHDEQDAVLCAVEAGLVKTPWTVAPALFFERLRTLTAEGYYADPGNGGNRDRAAWCMLGYDPRTPPRITAP